MSKKIIIILIDFALSLALVLVIGLSLFASVELARKKMNEDEEEIAEIERILEETERLSQEYQGISEEASKFLMALPTEEDVPHLLVQFEGLASNNGLLLESIQFEEDTESERVIGRSALEEEKSSYEVVPVALVLSGSYEAFKNYLEAVEDSLRPIEIHSISFSAPRKQEEILDIFQFDVRIEVYHTN